MVEHPNRDKTASRVTRAVVVVLLVVSAAIVAIVTVGGWATLEGAKAMQLAYIALYVLGAVLIARWKRGLLPVAGALAAVLLIFAAVSGPQWLVRDRPGFSDPLLDESVLAVLTLALVPLQLLLIAFAMRGFRRKWHVEVERPARGATSVRIPRQTRPARPNRPGRNSLR